MLRFPEPSVEVPMTPTRSVASEGCAARILWTASQEGAGIDSGSGLEAELGVLNCPVLCVGQSLLVKFPGFRFWEASQPLGTLAFVLRVSRSGEGPGGQFQKGLPWIILQVLELIGIGVAGSNAKPNKARQSSGSGVPGVCCSTSEIRPWLGWSRPP